MASIKINDFVKDVEANRKRLIDNARNKGQWVNDTASLSDAVTANENIIIGSPEEVEDTVEVRFFDIDGTLLKSEIIPKGGSVTPPPDPTYDSERLTFSRWLSAIGHNFDNIQHDVDYGAHYTINDNSYHWFFTLNDYTGYTVTLNFVGSVSGGPTIDWGDGVVETITATGNLTHTYSTRGHYEIIVKRSPDYPNYKFFTDINKYTNLGTANSMMAAIEKMYMPNMAYTHLGQNFTRLEILLYVDPISDTASSGGTISAPYTLFVHDISCWYKTLSASKYLCKAFVIDNTVSVTQQWKSSTRLYADKHIVPSTIKSYATGDTIDCKKLIALAPAVTGTVNGVETAEFLHPEIKSIPAISSPNLKKLIYPSSITSIGRIGTSSTPTCVPSKYFTSLSIPEGVTIPSDVFNSLYTRDLKLYAGYDQTLTLSYAYNLQLSSVINILNDVKDNSTTGVTRTISFGGKVSRDNYFTYVKLNNGIYELSDISDTDAISISEAFATKNWTIS